MKRLSIPTRILVFLLTLALLAGCTAAATPVPTLVSTISVPTATTPAKAQSFDDPFAYCGAVGTIDQPDARYTGPKLPESVVEGLKKASGMAADIPQEILDLGVFWRCMDEQVYVCFVGANLPCDRKANTSQEPTEAMNEFCQSNPGAEFIPAAATGHDTVYTWTCEDGKAVADEQVFQVDGQGYIREIWYPIAP